MISCRLELITWSRRMTPKSLRIGSPTGLVKPRVFTPSAPVAFAKEPESPVGSFAQTAVMVGLRPKPRGSHGPLVWLGPGLKMQLAVEGTDTPAQSVTAPGFKLYSTPAKWRIPSFMSQEGTRREISVELLNRRPS